jgi:hypothetical protein
VKEEYTGDVRFEAACEQAEAKGCNVVLPRPNQLFIDIDTHEDFLTFFEHRAMLDSIGEGGKVISDTPSKSGLPRRHIVLEFDRDLDNMERVLLQAVLGSDRKRELLSWIRIRSGASEHPTLFFEPKEQPVVAKGADASDWPF